jgi:ABC-type transporter Mla maintaining outer membrane lipid asymmetry ATPase subunit MlaF
MTIAVRFQNVSRYFGQVRAVDDVTLEVAEGEFFAMLGPSGSPDLSSPMRDTSRFSAKPRKACPPTAAT